MGRGALLAISVAAHVGLAIGLGRIERPVARAATAISMSESRKKPEPPRPVDDPPPPPDKEPAPRAPQRAKAAPAKAEAEPPAPPPTSGPGAASMDALPDFGLSLSGGSGTGSGGLAVAAAGPQRTAAPEKVVKRPQTLGPKASACDEPLVKPRAKNVPTPAYTEAGRAAAVEGKVRIEVTVDEQGRVVSVRVLQGLGHGLDEAALDAARRATFEPATQCGKAVAATFNIGMRFSL